MDSLRKFLKIAGFFPILFTAFAVTKRFWDWNFDDAMIVFRYVENVLNGSGWVYNPGEHYNACTSALNTIILIVFTYFTKNVFISAHVLGFFSLITIGISVYFILQKSSSLWFSALFSIVIVYLMGNNFTWGLETNLLYAIVLAFVCLDLYGKTNWYLLGLAILARQDALILFALCAAREIFIKKRLPLKGMVQTFLVVLPWALFSLYNFGNIFPATLHQKMWQGASGFWGTGPVFLKGLMHYVNGDTFQHIVTDLQPSVVMICPLVLCPQGLIQVVSEKNTSVQLLFLYIAAVLLAYCILNVPNYHWYYTGFLLGTYVFAAYGIIFIAKSYKGFFTPTLDLPLLLILIFVCGLALYRSKIDFFDVRTDVYKRLSEKINTETPENTKIASVEVGVFGYFVHRPFIDIVGLTTPYGEFITGKNNDKLFDELKPDIFILHTPLMPHEYAVYGDPRFTSRYTYKDMATSPGYSELTFFTLGPEKTLPEKNLEKFLWI